MIKIIMKFAIFFIFLQCYSHKGVINFYNEDLIYAEMKNIEYFFSYKGEKVKKITIKELNLSTGKSDMIFNYYSEDGRLIKEIYPDRERFFIYEYSDFIKTIKTVIKTNNGQLNQILNFKNNLVNDNLIEYSQELRMGDNYIEETKVNLEYMDSLLKKKILKDKTGKIVKETEYFYNDKLVTKIIDKGVLGSIVITIFYHRDKIIFEQYNNGKKIIKEERKLMSNHLISEINWYAFDEEKKEYILLKNKKLDYEFYE